jgi:hypothetical protein
MLAHCQELKMIRIAARCHSTYVIHRHAFRNITGVQGIGHSVSPACSTSSMEPTVAVVGVACVYPTALTIADVKLCEEPFE